MKNIIPQIIAELKNELNDLNCEYHTNTWLSERQKDILSNEIDLLKELVDILYLG